MFDSARTALSAAKAPTQPETVKSHSGLISAFSLHWVKTGQLPADLGRIINKAEDLRLVSDYKGDPLEEDQALWVVEQAEQFVSAIVREFFSSSADPEKRS